MICIEGGRKLRIFDMDGPIYKIGTELADIMILTLYWFICCIPIITIGASTSSLFYVYGKKARDEDVYVTKDFFKSFTENFKQSIPITIILLVLWVSVSMYLSILLAYAGQAPTLLAGVALFFTIEVTVMSVYILALLSRFYMKLSSLFMTAFVLAHKHLLTSLMIIVTFVVLTFATLFIPILMFVFPALVVAVLSFFIQKVFTKHIEDAAQQQEEDSVDVEEIGLEELEIEENKIATDAVKPDEEDKEENDHVEEEDKDFLKYI